MALQLDAQLGNMDAFAFEELFLERGVGFADEEFAATADYAMPGDAFSGRCGGHGASCASGATAQAQGGFNRVRHRR